GGYVDFIRRTHPEAPIPGVYLAEGLFRDAENLRRQMGDSAFFSVLGEGQGSGGGWGELEAGWDAARFEAAMVAPPGSEERSQLISALISKFFGSYDTQAGARGEAFLSLDKGLSVLSKHAADLGYDGLILFLDELVLWLASHAADLKFIHQEGQKLAKLVEAQTPDRPIPIISFVARQRDLSDLIGDSVPGADRLNFSDALKHWEGRFHKITLEDRNLPAIAEKRVLKTKGEAARQELDAAFEQTRSIRESVMNVLLTREGDRAMFRKVYPFSPALVQTLIAVSSVLQRERTALKVMMQLLVDHRETLKVGDIVPVGDLFDVVAHGDEAFSQEMAIHFDNAKRLYHQKLLPVLEKQHGRREDLEQLPYDDPRRAAFRNDNRLVKTLLLAALVPEVESLRSLTAERLAALNHGTIRTPIPGKEGQEVLRRCRTWAASVGEIRIGEEANPTISVQLSGVDTESIIKQAEREDNQGNRIRRVRQMLFEQLGVKGEGEIEQFYELNWRNTKRSCVVLFKNIRELSDSSLENTSTDWKLIIDFPFDEPGHGPKDDLSKLQAFRESHPAGARTLCWVPAFFSHDAQKDLGLLVILEHILTGERFGQYANQLSPQDRPAARSLLENQRSILRQRVQGHLDAAYGLEALIPGSLDTVHDIELGERFVSLWPGFEPKPPVAANLAGAMNHLVSQALEHDYPAAPAFEAEIKTSNLKKVLEVVSEAARAQDGRVPVDKSLRALVRSIANPLKLGEMGLDATHFVLGHHWRTHFTRKATETGAAMEVRQLRRWINEPKPMGLPKEAEHLVILTFAQQTNRSFFIHGAPFEATLTNVPDLCELREQKLPGEAAWATAVQRAGSIFGVAISPLLNAANVVSLTSQVKKRTTEAKSNCQSYCQKLRDHFERLGLDPASADRMRTAVATLQLLERIQQGPEDSLVETLASAAIATSEAAMGECVSNSGPLTGVLDATNWELFESVAQLGDERRTAAEAILASVAETLRCDEHARVLGPALKELQSKALRLITANQPRPEPTPEPPVIQPKPPAAQPGRRLIDQGTEDFAAVADAKAKLEQLAQQATNGRQVRLTIAWRIEEETQS
ncbi:MAG: phage resistance protein, partial [Isosphaeraceae bacterium]|nr:phage resistance protein [Isosphaeraceae bacterium]